MNALLEVYQRGADDADRRVAAALTPVPTAAADRYLSTSRFVMAADAAIRRLQDWWLASATAAALASIRRDAFLGAPRVVRYRSVAVVVLTAVIAHVALMLIQGPRPGWFWMVVPAMAALFALLVLAGSRSARSAD